MTIPNSQFYLYCSDVDSLAYQTYEEALKAACRQLGSSEFVDCTPDNALHVTLYFPKVDREINIHRKLFTYNANLPLITHIDYVHNAAVDYKNIGQ